MLFVTTSLVLLFTQSVIAIFKDPKISFDNLVRQMFVYLVQNMRSKATVIVDQVNLIQFTVTSYTARVTISCLFLRFVLIFKGNVLENVNVLISKKRVYF